VTQENGYDVTLRIPTALRVYTDRESSISLQGGTVREVMDGLVERHPALRKHLYDDGGQLRSFVRLYVNGEDIEKVGGIEAPLSPGDKLAIVPAIAGGIRHE
jgi:molybdopterin converting factor small subunit